MSSYPINSQMCFFLKMLLTVTLLLQKQQKQNHVYMYMYVIIFNNWSHNYLNFL